MPWLIAHLIGDYLTQNDWMAQNKKARTFPCLVHVTLYTAVVALLTFWPLWAIGVVFVTHFVQDRTRIINGYMWAMGQRDFIKPPLGPWSIVVVDNVWHLVTLFALSLAVGNGDPFGGYFR